MLLEYLYSIAIYYNLIIYFRHYENNTKVKIKHINKDICYCRIIGVITLQWIHFSQETFEFTYNPKVDNIIEFSMTNISKYDLPVTIIISKLSPNFKLTLINEEFSVVTETSLKIDFFKKSKVTFKLKFTPKTTGRFTSVAILYLDKNLSIPYYNLTFIGKRETPIMKSNITRIVFPPSRVDTKLSRFVDVTFNDIATLEKFSHDLSDENITVTFESFVTMEITTGIQTIITIKICLFSKEPHIGKTTLRIIHESGTSCEILLCYCFTKCPITLHRNIFVDFNEDPYPYYPNKEQKHLYDYMNQCTDFLEKWMFQQGFRKEFYPMIPESLNILSSAMQSQQSGGKAKGINVSYFNFIRRIAGPLMKYIRKIS